MGNLKADRLREARKRAGFDSASEAAQRFGWTESAFRHHENGTRGFGADAAKKYGRAFKVKPGWLLGLENVNDEPPTFTPTDDRLIVNGAVEAGAWRESTYWNDARTYVIEAMPSPVPNAKRFGLITAGASMDLAYEPGTLLDCISIFKNGVKPKSGDHVIAEQIRPDGLRELTVKEFVEEDGQFFLQPRSKSPKHQERIAVGAPDPEHIGESGIHVIAFVVASYPPRVIDLFERMGLKKPLT